MTFKTLRALSAALLCAGAALAQAQVTVTEPWVRGTVAQQKATAAFMQISSAKPVRLVSASSPLIPLVEIHEMVMHDNVMKMRQVPGLDIQPGHALALTPSGYHIMLMNLKAPLKAGDVVPLTLSFEDGATKSRFTQEVNAPVSALGGDHNPPAAQHKH